MTEGITRVGRKTETSDWGSSANASENREWLRRCRHLEAFDRRGISEQGPFFLHTQALHIRDSELTCVGSSPSTTRTQDKSTTIGKARKLSDICRGGRGQKLIAKLCGTVWGNLDSLY